MTLPAVIRAELTSRGWSVNRLAREASVRPSVVSDILTGVTADPRLSTVLALLGGLGHDLRWLHRKTHGAQVGTPPTIRNVSPGAPGASQ